MSLVTVTTYERAWRGLRPTTTGRLQLILEDLQRAPLKTIRPSYNCAFVTCSPFRPRKSLDTPNVLGEVRTLLTLG